MIINWAPAGAPVPAQPVSSRKRDRRRLALSCSDIGDCLITPIRRPAVTGRHDMLVCVCTCTSRYGRLMTGHGQFTGTGTLVD